MNIDYFCKKFLSATHMGASRLTSQIELATEGLDDPFYSVSDFLKRYPIVDVSMEYSEQRGLELCSPEGERVNIQGRVGQRIFHLLEHQPYLECPERQESVPRSCFATVAHVLSGLPEHELHKYPVFEWHQAGSPIHAGLAIGKTSNGIWMFHKIGCSHPFVISRMQDLDELRRPSNRDPGRTNVTASCSFLQPIPDCDAPTNYFQWEFRKLFSWPNLMPKPAHAMDVTGLSEDDERFLKGRGYQTVRHPAAGGGITKKVSFPFPEFPERFCIDTL